MSTEKLEGRFFSPRIKIIQVCHKCRACVHACPVKAIKWGVGEIIVDRIACGQHVLKKGECFNCATACYQGALILEEYELKDGKVTKVEK
ncbi:MAG: 4Fe-4S binding protein [Candidatus Helarchaeales archaeon]